MDSVLEYGTRAEREARFSRAPCAPSVASPPPKTVVLMPPDRPIERAFELARSLLDGGAGSVRVVGTCAALAHAWPPWATTLAGLITTDIGAYRARSRIASTRALAADVNEWLQHVFGNFGGIDHGSRAFYGEACVRLFDEVLTAHPFVEGLAEGLIGCNVHCVEDWVGRPMLDALLKPTGGRCLGPSPTSAAAGAGLFGLSMTVHAAVFAVGAMAEIVRHYARSSSSRAFIRRQHETFADPKTWVMLLPTWWRMNRHVIQSFVLPEDERGGGFGTLFFGDLAPGMRSEHNLRKLEGTTLFAGLGPGRDAVLRSPMGQVICPDSPLGLGRTLVAASTRAARATWRVARGPREVWVGGHCVSLAGKVSQVAKLVTVAAARATSTELATRSVTKRFSLNGATVVMATSSLAETAMADLVLQSCGATTVDFVHGTKGDGWAGSTESISTYQFVWTNSDREAVRPTGQACIAAGMPRPTIAPRTRPRAGRRVLIMSSYLHRDSQVGGRFPLLAAQHELLSIVDAFTPSGVTFRWRPHPADNPEAVAKAHREHAKMELSVGAPLERDLEWADAVITVHSSAMFEALFADVPVFLQAQPDLWGTAATDCLDPARVFYWASDGVAVLKTCLARLELAGDQELEPERRALRHLFGATCEPRTVRAAVDEIEARRATSTAS